MPCYLFTLHAHGSWMPDHRRGYVQRGAGIHGPDPHMAALYAARTTHQALLFTAAMQLAILKALQDGCVHQEYRLHAVFFEVTHVHFLVSWRRARKWPAVRAGLRQSASRALNARFGRRLWFVHGGSRRRVRERGHFDYLMTTYCAKHSGLKWVEGQAL